MFMKTDIWNVQETDFPATGTSEEKLKFILNYAILAPSSHNTQPWCFKIDSGGYPQIMLRLGFGLETKPTPRRTVDEVVSN
ncbi:hypothetical protein NIES2101_41915 [Calothrix sp. HK-06]|nr:hypothetical protein NIES2101_41915 [Calothrix sp. HK-06]